MMEGDSRTDDEADRDWHLASSRLLGDLSTDPAERPLPTFQLHSVTPAMSVETVSDLPSRGPPLPRFDVASAYLPLESSPPAKTNWLREFITFPPDEGPHLNSKTVRRILSAKESIFKYGIYLPRHDRDADSSPEKLRWRSGRQLEWLRLKAVGAFEYDWSKARLAQEFPQYLFSDIGSLFYIYDYKFTFFFGVRWLQAESFNVRRHVLSYGST
jgi:hypothetical protein